MKQTIPKSECDGCSYGRGFHCIGWFAKKVIIATLFNAPLTISNYFCSRVNHDMAKRFV